MISIPSKKEKGLILVNALVFALIASSVTAAMVGWAASIIRNERRLLAKEQAFHIAEAGIDYYRWHLAHAQTDYTDGTTTPGPYIHTVEDKDGVVLGQYALTITPPATGTTVVVVKSEGSVASDPEVKRTIRATLAIQSLAKYAVVSNDFLRFGEGTEVFGPVHSNDGVRFDGLAHNLISSTKDKFIDTENGTAWRFGVYTTVDDDDPSPPAAIPDRPDVFMAGRLFPAPAFDFTGLTSDMSHMKAIAQADSRYFAASGAQGYHVVLKTDDTFDLYRVNTLLVGNNKCGNELNQAGWGTWSINTETFLQNYSFPTSGVIFFEDHIWVDGTINTAKISIVAGKFPDSAATRKSITVNADLLYTNYDGRDVIGLLAQDNLNVGMNSPNDIRIDAAIISQNGRIGRYYYETNCGANANRNYVMLYGMLASAKRYGFSYTDGTGYDVRDIVYDGYLLYGPPPSFPLTSDQYTVISWEEIR
ncbi:MAG: hypothetical protein V4526_02040 [Patescibacteria group bacterium]